VIEYPSIMNSSKAPRKSCIAFDKLDGSNFRAKFTQKQGFSTFGTRTQLIDETSEFWGDMVYQFRRTLEEPLTRLFKGSKDFRDQREIIVFGEYFGDSSFAGRHEDEPRRIVVFDVLVGHKQRKFLLPQEFLKVIAPLVPTPRVVCSGNLGPEMIQKVREDAFGTKEGVVCKGTERSGAFAGGVWMCKIKTQAYLDSLKETFGPDWTKYGE
jgi:hypothetical protein